MEVNPRLSASRGLSRSLQMSRLLFKKQLWVWPLAAAVILMVVGYAMRRAVDRALKQSIASQLQTVLEADVAALDVWMRDQQSYAEIVADDPRIGAAACRLIELAARDDVTPAVLATSQDRKELEAALKPWFDRHAFEGYVLADVQQRIVASQNDELVGKKALAGYGEMLAAVLQGKTVITRPFPSVAILVDDKGKARSNVPTMFAAAPLRDSQGAVVGALALRISPEADFTRILNVARMGKTGETYAFDRAGLMVSQSRFDDQLKGIGLIPDRDDSHSLLSVELRDPQVDMTRGKRPRLRRSQQPLTRMASEAIAGRPGVDVQGYRDYRGVPTFGAWTWLDKYGIGVATEVDAAEAERPGQILAWAFWGLFALLAISSLAIFVFTLVVARLRQKARHATLAAKRLGQYTLDEKIGAGGMGVVYRGHHAMLRRPTAIKLLDVDKTTDDAIKRFEREVSLTSQLNHPNTIAIYDYGRTPDGIFYYAMEYLDGIDLEKLVRSDGPQPEGRVIHILLQVCGSLSEAHAQGLIHRDIKPANIFLTRRGGLPDFVKLLDFGLVKAVDTARSQQVTAASAITGTPLYMSPEAIQTPEDLDPRSDLYALGAVGYFLLTGTPPFSGKSVVDLCHQQVMSAPELPSHRLGKAVSTELEKVLLWCLEKSPGQRPQSAVALAEALRNCPARGAWTDADAAAWWQNSFHLATTVSAAPSTVRPTEDRTAIWTGE
jgi:hypothetical protein